MVGTLCAILLTLMRIRWQKHPGMEAKGVSVAWNKAVKDVFQGWKKPV